jgi:hypothetical protein
MGPLINTTSITIDGVADVGDWFISSPRATMTVPHGRFSGFDSGVTLVRYQQLSAASCAPRSCRLRTGINVGKRQPTLS